MFPCRNNFCNKYVKSVISDLYKITKCEIQKTKNKTFLLTVYISLDILNIYSRMLFVYSLLSLCEFLNRILNVDTTRIHQSSVSFSCLELGIGFGTFGQL